MKSSQASIARDLAALGFSNATWHSIKPIEDTARGVGIIGLNRRKPSKLKKEKHEVKAHH